MIVVSDTSPITNLAAVGQFELLRLLHGEVHIAEGVWDELNAGDERWPGRDEVAAAQWAHRRAVSNRALVVALQRDLDRGEAESIALALELDADLVLLDEREGRRAAQRLGLRVVGVLGLLLEAKAKSLVPAMRPYLDALRESWVLPLRCGLRLCAGACPRAVAVGPGWQYLTHPFAALGHARVAASAVAPPG